MFLRRWVTVKVRSTFQKISWAHLPIGARCGVWLLGPRLPITCRRLAQVIGAGVG